MKSSEKIWNRRFILLFITNLLVLAAFYASIPIIPIYCQEIGITGSKVGIVLTAMSVATILFRPVAGYLLDNFNRYRVYLVFLALFCLSFPAFLAFPLFGALIVIRLYMGAVYSVCGSATMTLAGDVLPAAKITEGISRFAFTVPIGMAVGPYVGLQVQSHMSSAASFWTIFGITVAALVCVSCCRIRYPKVERKKFSIRDTIYGPALPFMFNMMFLMIPYGAVIAYSSIFAQEKGLSAFLPYFYIFLVAGMLVSKLSTQKMIDAGHHRVLVYLSLAVLILTMLSYLFLNSGVHLLARRLLLWAWLRHFAAAVSVLRHRNHPGTPAGRGQRHLHAFLRCGHRHRFAADGLHTGEHRPAPGLRPYRHCLRHRRCGLPVLCGRLLSPFA